MSNNYTPTAWIGGKTVGTADVMNNIEQGIGLAHDKLDNIGEQFSVKTNHDFVNLSSYKIGVNPTEKLQNALNYTALNGLKLYIDENVSLESTIDIPSNSQVYSNPRKYTISTRVGTIGDGMILMSSYGKSRIYFEGVRFQNTGFGSSGSLGTLGYFDSFGAGLCFGGCTNVTVKNCEFFMCGGYNYYEGCAQLWFSCCQNVLVDGNICELGDNGIIVDRWCQSHPSVTKPYNSGIIITNNRITNMSGRSIGLESVYGNGEYIISNNYCASFGVAGIQGDGFDNAVITSNSINGDIALRENPKIRYGLTLPGWDWSTKITLQEHVGILASYADRGCVITGNNISNVKTGIESIGTQDINILSNTICSVSNGIYCHSHETKTTVCSNISIISNNIRNTSEISILLDNSNGLGDFKYIMLSSNHIHTYKTGIKILNSTQIDITSNKICGKGVSSNFNDNYTAIYLDTVTKSNISSNFSNNHFNYMYLKNCSMLIIDDTARSCTNCIKLEPSSTSTDVYMQGTYRDFTSFLTGDGNIKGDARESVILNISGNHKSYIGHNLLITIRRSNLEFTGLASKGDVILNTSIDTVDSYYKWILISNIGETKSWKGIK